MKTVGRFLVQKCICFNTPVETTGVTFPLDPSHPTDKGGPSARKQCSPANSATSIDGSTPAFRVAMLVSHAVAKWTCVEWPRWRSYAGDLNFTRGLGTQAR